MPRPDGLHLGVHRLHVRRHPRQVVRGDVAGVEGVAAGDALLGHWANLGGVDRASRAYLSRALAVWLALGFGGCAGYGLGSREALRAYEAGDAAGYRRGLEEASRRWPIQRSAYTSERAYREAVRQSREW